MKHDDEPGQSDPTEQVEQVVGHIERRADRIRDRELDVALSKLETLEERERAVIERLARRLTDRLIAPPKRGLERAAERDDEEAIAVARELFGD